MTMQFLLHWTRKIGATCLFLGYFPFGPGTVGAAITIVTLYFARDSLSFMLGPENLMQFWLVMLGLTALCMFLTHRAKDIFGLDDPPQVIFDEVVGQFITFFMVPINIRTLLLGFVLFRFFDIVKPYPVHHMEEAEGGVGVTMDDVAAGVMANISLLGMLAAYNWLRAYL